MFHGLNNRKLNSILNEFLNLFMKQSEFISKEENNEFIGFMRKI